MEKLGMNQLKKLFKRICTPIERIDNGHYDFCRIYKVNLLKESRPAVLKVYDLDADGMDKMLVDGEIKEIHYYRQLRSEVFPRFLDSGFVMNGTNHVAYMLTEYQQEALTLTQVVQCIGTLGKKFAAFRLFEIASALNELQKLTSSGGHYNVSPDNILVSGQHVYIVGTTHMCENCTEEQMIETRSLPIGYRSKDNLLGNFTSQCDVYSFCMTANFMIIGDYPFPFEQPMSGYTAEACKALLSARKAAPSIALRDEKMKDFLIKGLSEKRRTRFKNMQELLIPLQDAVDLNGLMSKMAKQQNESKRNEDQQCQIRIDKCQGKGFAEVAGMEDLKKTLIRDYVKVLQNLKLARTYNITPPNIILYGPPGCGKTYIANRLAEECGLAYSYVKPSDLASTYIHGTEGKVADLFEKASTKAPCLLCIDEIDSMIPRRGSTINDNRNDEVAEWLTQLNECVDKGVYVVAMTNRICDIDEAVLRSGRFDAKFFVPLPDQEEREELFRYSLGKCPTSAEIDVKELANLTDRYSSSDIVTIVKDAAREAFDRTIISNLQSPMPINQELLVEMLKRSHPSVSVQSLREYEREREQIENKSSHSRSHIGFQ